MNKYQKKFNKLSDEQTFKGQQWFGKRKQLVEEYSWAVPNEEALRYLAEFDELIEVGAGNGYWAKCIEECGGNVVATDIDPPEDTWVDVEQASVSDLYLTGESVLSVWPPLQNDMSTRLVEAEPAHIVYVGETRGGCTASEGFFELIDTYYGLVGKIEIPSYVGIHDNLFHYTRKI